MVNFKRLWKEIFWIKVVYRTVMNPFEERKQKTESCYRSEAETWGNPRASGGDR